MEESKPSPIQDDVRLKRMVKVGNIIKDIQERLHISSSEPLEVYLSSLGVICESAWWDGDKLFILISNPVVAHQLRFQIRDLKNKIAHDLNRKVLDIRISVGSKSR